MSDTDVKPSSHDVYSTIRKLSSPNDESNWDTWSFAMRMMLRGKNLEYVIEGGYKEGYNGIDNVLPPTATNSDNRVVSSVIASRVHEDNYSIISPCQDSAKRMWRALQSAHQINTAGGRYMYLRSMMTTRANGDEDVSKLITNMDIIRQRLLNVCPEGTVSVDDIYVSSLISALPESWTSVTAPLELQAHVTPAELKKVLRGHVVKLKNRDTATPASTSTALSATVPSKKNKNKQGSSRPECDYCQYRGHTSEVCHRKMLEDQKREIESLKNNLKSTKTSKSAKVAQLSDSDTDSSLDEIPNPKKKASSAASRVKFSRAATHQPKSGFTDAFTYNADTGCTDTMVTSTTSLKSSTKIPKTPIYMADDTIINATSIGPIVPPIPIPSIPGLVVPGLAENLLSIGQLADHDVTSVFTKEGVEFYKSPVDIAGVKLGEGSRVNKKYMVRPITALHTSTLPASLLTWHLRLSHLGETSIRRLHAQGVIKVNDWDRQGLETCIACKEGRFVRRKFGSRDKYRAKRVLEVIHSDVCQLSHPSHDGYVYFVTFIDDYSKLTVVYLLQYKSQVYESFLHFINHAERETGQKVVELRSDNGGEYVSTRMKTWCAEHGIKQVMGPPHTPELNGIAERYNRTLLHRLKPSLKHSTLHQSYWSDALSYAVWTTNRSPTRTNLGFKTPYEVYKGSLPSMSHAQIFGAKGCYLVPSANRKKLDNHTRRCYFLGVLPNGDGMKVLDASSKKVIKTRDAFFHQDFLMEQPNHKNHQDLSSFVPSTSPWLYPEQEQGGAVDPQDIAAHQEPEDQYQGPGPQEEPHNPQRPQRARRQPIWYGNVRAHTAAAGQSPTYKSAMKSSDSLEWKSAMEAEINKLVERGVFSLVPKPKDCKIISSRWHLKKKLNLDGSVKKFKARLVARGFSQRPGIDYTETFAPSSRQESLKAFLAVNGNRDWEVIQMDIVGAFLYGGLDEEIYMSQPEGFIDPDHPEHVWRLNASLYGLKQSARQWYTCFTDQLKLMGFKAAQVDPTMYILHQEGVAVATIIVHVDDILLAGKTSCIEQIENTLQEKFQLTRNDEVSQFLSFDISRDRESRTFTMNQSSYVNDLVEQYGLEDARSVTTPCDENFKDLCKNDDPSLVTSHPYCNLVGALLWLSNGTRPDITFAVNRLSAFMSSPTDVHWKAAQRVLIYARDTSQFSITLGGHNLELSGHSDSDWAEQREDRRSTTGFIFYLGNSPVSWKSRRQPTIALSSTEAEYMAITDASREAIWWRAIMNELEFIDLSKPTIIHYDNKGAGDLARNPCHHSRSKHIDVKHHFIRECISNLSINIKQVSTSEMLADILTKPLKRVKHSENIKKLFGSSV